MAFPRPQVAIGELPRKGHLLPDLWLATRDGVEHTVAAYRGHKTCVVIATGDQGSDFLHHLADRTSDFLAEEVVVVAILPHAPDDMPERGDAADRRFPIVAFDAGGKAHARIAGGSGAWAVYVTDRYGEITAAWRADTHPSPPSIDEILEWARYTNLRCDECFPSEWPD